MSLLGIIGLGFGLFLLGFACAILALIKAWGK